MSIEALKLLILVLAAAASAFLVSFRYALAAARWRRAYLAALNGLLHYAEAAHWAPHPDYPAGARRVLRPDEEGPATALAAIERAQHILCPKP